MVAMTRCNALWPGLLLADGSVSKVGVSRSFFGTGEPDGMAMDVERRLVVAHPSLRCAFVVNTCGEVTHVVRTDIVSIRA